MADDLGNFARDTMKSLEVCGKVVELCHRRVFSVNGDNMSIEDLERLMGCLEAAWMMNANTLQVFGSIEKLEGLASGEDEDTEGDDETPPYP